MSENDTKNVRVLISGRVQGVCFRACTRDQAQILNLSGWVRNLSDGRVEAWLEVWVPDRPLGREVIFLLL